MTPSFAQERERPALSVGKLPADRSHGGGMPADLHPGLVSLPGSISMFAAGFPRSPNRSDGPMLRLSHVKHRPTPFRDAIQTAFRGCAGHHGFFFTAGRFGVARENLSLTNPLQPGSDRLREVSNVRPVGALHSQRMEQASVEVVASAYANERE